MTSINPSKRVKALQLLNFARETLMEHDRVVGQFANHEITYKELCEMQKELRKEVSWFQKEAEMTDPKAQLWMLYL
jgi:hypothetical protein